jgi:hypothetical protein
MYKRGKNDPLTLQALEEAINNLFKHVKSDDFIVGTGADGVKQFRELSKAKGVPDDMLDILIQDNGTGFYFIHSDPEWRNKKPRLEMES